MLRRALGPWAVSGPAIHIGAQALDDRHWVTRATERLSRDTARLDDLLGRAGFAVRGGTLLFRLARHAEAPRWFERLGRAGMLVRRFAGRPDQLRFGLPGSDEAWQRLTTVLDRADTKQASSAAEEKVGKES
jgi:cobalamin biosynthetic protein CobC